MPMSPLRLGLVPGALLLLSCGNATAPLCTTPVSVSIQDGTPPTIGWAGSCSVDEVRVSVVLAPSAGGDQPQWWIRAAASGMRVSGPIRYGVTPFGMKVLLGPVALVMGHTYDVQVLAQGLSVGDGSFQR